MLKSVRMQQDIYVSGIGQTPFGEWWEKGLRELADEAISAAIEDAPCNVLDIDLVIVSNMLAEKTNAQAHLGSLVASLLPHHPPALRAEAACASGAVALHTAVGMLESGRAETVLVVGVEKMTDVSGGEIASALMGAADSEKDQSSGLTFPGIFGLIATAYMAEFGLTREDLNIVSSKHHTLAAANPNAQFRSPIPAEKISQSPAVADPLCQLDCSPISDGAAAVILSTKHKSQFKLTASALSTDTLSLTERSSLTSFVATKDAARQAFEESGLTPENIDHIELHDCFSIAALINLEDLGFSEPGEGIKIYRQESPTPTVNASGGLKACGHPVGATGLKQICDLTKQLKNSKKRYGLAHNFGGAAATSCVHILERTS